MSMAIPAERRQVRAARRLDRQDLVVFLFVGPALVYLLAFAIYPLFYSLRLSFTDLTAADGTGTWIGLRNYRDLLVDPQFWNAAMNSAIMVAATVAIQIVLGTALALFFDLRLKGSWIVRGILVLPMLITPIVVGVMWRALLNPDWGLVDWAISAIGLEPPDWLGSTEWAMRTLVLVDTWQWTPFVFIIVFARLQALPQEVFEAAQVDGAGYLSTLWHVTLPLLTPALLFAAIFRAVDGFRSFDLIYGLSYGGPARTTTTLAFFSFQNGFQFQNYGYAAAVAYTMLLVLMIGTTVLLRYAPLRPGTRAMKHRIGRIVAYLVLIALGVVGAAPFLYLLVLSSKRRIEILSQVPPRLTFNWDTIARTYNEVLFSQGMLAFTRNSLIVVGAATLVALIIGTPAAYAFSRIRFRGDENLINAILSMRFMPPIAVAIPPLPDPSKAIGLQDSYAGLILPYVAFSLPLIIWILIGFFDEVPRELDDAAMVDGCTRLGVLWRVMLPVMRPGLVTAALFAAIFIWNEFLVALYVIDSRDYQTISLGAATLVSAQRPIDWNIAAAVGVVTVIPILLFSLLVQRYIVRGLTAGGREMNQTAIAKPELVTTGLGWPEGPTVQPDGSLVFVESYRSQLSVVARSGGPARKLAYTAGSPNSCVLGGDGALYVCQNGGTVGPWRAAEMSVPSIQKVRPGGKAEILCTEVEGIRLNGPNDLVFAGDGRLVFTDPGTYNPASPDPSYIFALAPDGTPGVVMSFPKPVFPNGVAVEADGSIVWDDSYTGHVRRKRPDGKVEDLGRMPGDNPVLDGMKIGADGRLYVTDLVGKGIHVVRPDGKIDGFIPVGGAPTNCAFDGETLWVTDATVLAASTEPNFAGQLWRLHIPGGGMPTHRGTITRRP